MKYPFLLLLFLQLFCNTIICSEYGASSPQPLSRTGSALSLCSSAQDITALSDEESDDEEPGAIPKTFVAAHVSDDEESKPLPKISALLELENEGRKKTIGQLTAEQTEQLLLNLNDYLTRKHTNVTGKKKIFTASKRAMLKEEKPFRALEQQVDEQTAAVAVAVKKLEEMTREKEEAQEIYEAAKKTAVGHHRDAQQEVDAYNAAVALRDGIHTIVYTKAEEANPTLRLARQIREKEKADKARLEAQRIKEEWQQIEMDDFEGADQTREASGVDDEEEGGWFETTESAVGYVGSALYAGGKALYTGARIAGEVVVERVLPDPTRR